MPRQQTAFVYGFPTVTRANADRFPLTVLENIVSGRRTDPQRFIREKQGLAYTVASQHVLREERFVLYLHRVLTGERSEGTSVVAGENRSVAKRRCDEGRGKKAIAYSVGVHDQPANASGSGAGYAARFIQGSVDGVKNYSSLMRRSRRSG